MLLGSLIKRTLREEPGAVADLTLAEPGLALGLGVAAARAGLSPAAYLAEALRDFLAAEDGEAWTTVTGKLQGGAGGGADADPPGTAFLAAVLRRHLRLEAG